MDLTRIIEVAISAFFLLALAYYKFANRIASEDRDRIRREMRQNKKDLQKSIDEISEFNDHDKLIIVEETVKRLERDVERRQDLRRVIQDGK